MRIKHIHLFIIVLMVLIPNVYSSEETSEIPSLIVRFFPEERINAYSVGPDNVAVLTGYILRNGAVEEIVEAGVPNPSVNVFLTNNLAGNLEISLNPLPLAIEAVDSGEMRIQGVGWLNEIKVQAFLGAIRLSGPEKAVTLPKMVPPETSLKGFLRDISEITDEGTYLIDNRNGLTHSVIEVSASKEYAESALISVKEYYGLLNNEVPQDVRSFSSQKGEEPVGIYLDIEYPKEAFWILIEFNYNESELYSKNLVEDKLKVKLYNETSLNWATLNLGQPPWVKEARVDKNKNLFRLNISHNSVFGLNGPIQPRKIPKKISVKSESAGTFEVEVPTESRKGKYLFYILPPLLILVIIGLVYLYKRKFKK
jgi:hypothetical protein